MKRWANENNDPMIAAHNELVGMVNARIDQWAREEMGKLGCVVPENNDSYDRAWLGAYNFMRENKIEFLRHCYPWEMAECVTMVKDRKIVTSKLFRISDCVVVLPDEVEKTLAG